MKTIALGIFFLFLFSFTHAISLEEMPPPQGYVTDLVGVLSEEEKQLLEDKLIQIEAESTVEIAVVIIDSTNGRQISDFAFGLGNKWKIGKKDTFNGVLILVAISDREYFIATAKGIEGTLPDLLAHIIGEENFPANFQNGQYFDGLNGAVYDLNGYIAQDPSIVSKYSSAQEAENFDGTIILLLFLSFAIIPLAGSIAKLFGAPRVVGILAYDIIAGAWIFLSTEFFLAIFLSGFLLVISFIFLVMAYVPTSGMEGFGGHRGGGYSGSSGSSHSGSHSFGGGGGFSGGGSGGRW